MPNVVRPLTLLLPVIPNKSPEEITITLGVYGRKLFEALTTIGTVHYARALVFDRSSANLQPQPGSKGPFVIAVITEYDGDFDDYVQDFVAKVGEVFEALLKLTVGGDKLLPLSEHVEEFKQLLAANDASYKVQALLFKAYGDASVEKIKAALRTT